MRSVQFPCVSSCHPCQQGASAPRSRLTPDALTACSSCFCCVPTPELIWLSLSSEVYHPNVGPFGFEPKFGTWYVYLRSQYLFEVQNCTVKQLTLLQRSTILHRKKVLKCTINQYFFFQKMWTTYQCHNVLLSSASAFCTDLKSELFPQ